MFRLWTLILLSVFAPAFVHAQSAWSVDAQKARIKREDDAFFRHLPENAQKRQELTRAHLQLPYGERILQGWQPGYESNQKPTTLKPRTGADLTGRWQRKQGVLGAAFGIKRQGATYQVNFFTWDGKGSEVFHRTGILNGAFLQLNKPVFDVVERPFSKIYVVRVSKEARLLPSSDVAILEQLGRTPHRPQAIAGLTFRKIG